MNITINADLQFILAASLTIISLIIILFNSPFDDIPITIAAILMAIAIFITTIPHNKECLCNSCFNYVGTINGIKAYENNNKIYYKNLKGMYIEIFKNDGTDYTYQDYIQDQLKEVQ